MLTKLRRSWIFWWTDNSWDLSQARILDNILAFSMGNEYVCLRKFLAIFLKLDILKAYDRLNHVFLKEVLIALGFSPLIVSLIMGLVCNGFAKVHANGLFSTPEFELGRWVRHGCPLAPLLFSLTMQPLILMLKQSVAEGRLQGFPIGDCGFQQLLCQLFADDTGLFRDFRREF